MPPANNNGTKDQPRKDPYDVLGIDSTASDADIGRAYRKLALKLHPDKNSSLTPSEAEDLASQFQDVREARAFLLDPEHAEERRKYDAGRESERRRKQMDEVRERSMGERRRRMGQELKEKEALARRQEQERLSGKRRGQGKHGTTGAGAVDDDLVEQLRRDGKRRREERAERDIEKELERQAKQTRKADASILEDRQIRLKWDRKKIDVSPSEDSLAMLLSQQFGPVESVELLGKKGNQALVTFSSSSSCQPCVEYYANSAQMRAKFVGRRKEQHDRDDEQENDATASTPHRTQHDHAGESLEDRKRRQAAEREQLLRTMEMEEDVGKAGKKREKPIRNNRLNHDGKQMTSLFPLPIPLSSKGGESRSPLDALEEFEDSVLGALLSSEQLHSMKAASATQ